MVTVVLVFSITEVSTQNLIKNPDFLIFEACPDYTGIWAENFFKVNTLNDWFVSEKPDKQWEPIFIHSCSEKFTFFNVPFFSRYKVPYNAGCGVTIVPPKDDGMLVLNYPSSVTSQPTQAGSITTLLDSIKNISPDYYCGFQLFTSPTCRDLPSCYFYQPGVIIEMQDKTTTTVIPSNVKLKDNRVWQTIDGCYRATGREKYLTIKSTLSDPFKDSECFNFGNTEPTNWTQVVLDNIIFTPFNILPETLVVCDENQEYFRDLRFYEVRLFWEDINQKTGRTFHKTGYYTLKGETKTKCELQEKIYVIFTGTETNFREVVTKCKDADAVLKIDIPGDIQWEDGSQSKTLTVSKSGNYSAVVITDCNKLNYTFEVKNDECKTLVQVANIIHLGSDNGNSKATFYFKEFIKRNGILEVYDRWGNLIFKKIKTGNTIEWDGTSEHSKPVTSGVYLWLYKDEEFMENGTITVIN